jgi:sortase (surface protein transpeptidase)
LSRPIEAKFFGSRREGWYVGQAYYPFLVEPIFVYKPMHGETRIQNSAGVIYHCYPGPARKPATEIGLDVSLSVNFLRLAKITALAGLAFLFISFAPSIWYSITSFGGFQTAQVLSQPLLDETREFNFTGQTTYLPRFDASLSQENRIKIPAIGVDTQVQEATADNFEEALKKGAWRVSDFGTPVDRNSPTILAAHRFGYLYWTNSFRRKNSFYNLSKLKVGETLEIVWKQRKYLYEIYAESKGNAIVDYSGDLILYTCEALNSPVRIFKYGRLLEV